jgi:hypothetical protein
MVYLQYWLCEENVTRNFFPHLDHIKVAFYVGRKIKRGVVVSRLLDSMQIDVQAFIQIHHES